MQPPTGMLLEAHKTTKVPIIYQSSTISSSSSTWLNANNLYKKSIQGVIVASIWAKTSWSMKQKQLTTIRSLKTCKTKLQISKMTESSNLWAVKTTSWLKAKTNPWLSYRKTLTELIAKCPSWTTHSLCWASARVSQTRIWWIWHPSILPIVQ